MINITHSEFIDNSVTAPFTFLVGGIVQSELLYLDRDMMTVSLSGIINNKPSSAVVFV